MSQMAVLTSIQDLQQTCYSIVLLKYLLAFEYTSKHHTPNDSIKKNNKKNHKKFTALTELSLFIKISDLTFHLCYSTPVTLLGIVFIVNCVPCVFLV